jgi:DNA integrity scanning protein DisA with diadenylate cyclase activity
MIATFFDGIAASPWMRAALRYGTIALAIILFLLSIRRTGERVGRLAERLETREKANEIQRRMLEAAARRPRNRDELVDRLRDGGF